MSIDIDELAYIIGKMLKDSEEKIKREKWTYCEDYEIGRYEALVEVFNLIVAD